MVSAINQVLEQYAENLELLAVGKEPVISIDYKTLDMAMKFIDKTGNLEQFEKFANGQPLGKLKVLPISKEVDEPEVEEINSIGNTLEERMKVVKKKLNGVNK